MNLFPNSVWECTDNIYASIKLALVQPVGFFTARCSCLVSRGLHSHTTEPTIWKTVDWKHGDPVPVMQASILDPFTSIPPCIQHLQLNEHHFTSRKKRLPKSNHPSEMLAHIMSHALLHINHSCRQLHGRVCLLTQMLPPCMDELAAEKSCCGIGRF